MQGLFKTNVKDTFRNLFTTIGLTWKDNKTLFKTNVKDTFRNLFTTITHYGYN